VCHNTDPNGNPGQSTSREVDERIPQWISERGQYSNTAGRYELFIEYLDFLHLLLLHWTMLFYPLPHLCRQIWSIFANLCQYHSTIILRIWSERSNTNFHSLKSKWTTTATFSMCNSSIWWISLVCSWTFDSFPLLVEENFNKCKIAAVREEERIKLRLQTFRKIWLHGKWMYDQ